LKKETLSAATEPRISIPRSLSIFRSFPLRTGGVADDQKQQQGAKALGISPEFFY
jgi:hypothetical protein